MEAKRRYRDDAARQEMKSTSNTPNPVRLIPFKNAALAATCFALQAFAGRAESLSLEAGFAKPPAHARPLAWWHWINGNVSKEGIRADMEDMKRVGIAGAQMLDVSIYLPPGPVRYGSDLWHEHVQYAIRTADELGLEFYLMNCPGWSASGGPWNTPERSMKQYTWSETEVEGGKEVSVPLAQPAAKLDFYRDVVVLAVPWTSNVFLPAEERRTAPQLKSVTPYNLALRTAPIAPGQVLNLTRFTDSAGILKSVLPAGRWTILRFGFTSTGSKNHPAVPEGHGLECDKFDAAAVEFHFERSMSRIIREAGSLVGKSFKGILFDSFEGGFQNWSDAFPQEFQRSKGYDLLPFVPVLTGRVVGSVDESEAVLRDFRSVVNELIAKNYFGTMQTLAHQHGLTVYAEAQGGPLNPYLCNAFTDVPMNEFWMPDATPRYHLMKQVASIVNVSGRSITAAEAFTAKPEDGRWLATPATMKAPGDCAFTAGINRFILHTYVHQPYSDIAPGFTLGRYGTHFGRLNTWWPFAGAWVEYVARCQFLLQQGRTVADIAFFANEDVGHFMAAKSLEVPRGFDFDVCYPRDLARMAWSDGAFHLPQGSAFRVLVLPEKWFADIATLRRLEAFVAAGATVLGPAPSAPTGWRELQKNKPEWDALVERLWGTKGERRVKPRKHLKQTLDELRIAADCEIATEPAGATVRFIHRRTGDTDIYYLSNQSGAPVKVRPAFRARNRTPELWDAVTGRIHDASEFRLSEGCTSVPITLDTAGSIFVVFRRSVPAKPAANESNRMPGDACAPDSLSISGPWRVRFPPGRLAPAEIRMETLASWTQNDDPGVRYFSGIATYQNSFNLPTARKLADARCVLRLGKVSDVAEVKINGRPAGVAWTPPFELDVTEWVRPGSNSLDIRVANRWVNRLIGDEFLPPDARYEPTGSIFTSNRLAELPSWLGDAEATRKRQRVTFATWHFYEKDSPLLESGLIGPVRLHFTR